MGAERVGRFYEAARGVVDFVPDMQRRRGVKDRMLETSYSCPGCWICPLCADTLWETEGLRVGKRQKCHPAEYGRLMLTDGGEQVLTV